MCPLSVRIVLDQIYILEIHDLCFESYGIFKWKYVTHYTNTHCSNLDICQIATHKYEDAAIWIKYNNNSANVMYKRLLIS